MALLVLVAAAAEARGAGAHLLLDIHDAVQPDPGSVPIPLGVLADGRAVFAASDAAHGLEPWVSDGTPGGTRRLGDLCPGECDGVDLVTVRRDVASLSAGDEVYFVGAAEAGIGTSRLWVTDGSLAGTKPLPVEREALEHAGLITDRSGRLFVRSGTSLWVSDGTVAGTRHLELPALRWSGVDSFGGRLGEGVWFVAGTGVGGTQEPWVSDGTAGGTRRLLAGPAVAGPIPNPNFPAYRFAALDDGSGIMLQVLGRVPGSGSDEGAVAMWSTDGTPEGTRRIRLLEEQWPVDSEPLGGPRAAFVTTSADGTQRVWTSDGTASGSRVVSSAQGEIRLRRWIGGRLLVSVHAGEGDRWELRSLGPEGEVASLGFFSGTFRLDTLRAQGTGFVSTAAGVAFLSREAERQELWRSDGTRSGTRRVAVLCDGACSPRAFLPTLGVPGRLHLAVQEPRSWSLLASDGTALASFDGSAPLRAMELAGTTLLFAADDGAHGVEPWVSNGSAGGTRLLSNLALPVSNGDALPRGLTRWGDRVLFFARDAQSWGLWESDGTAAGTRLRQRIAGTGALDEAFGGLTRLVLVDDRFLFFAQPTGNRVEGELKVVDLAARRIRNLGRFPHYQGEAVALNGGLLWAILQGPMVISDGTAEGTRVLDAPTGGGSPVSLDRETALFNGAHVADSGFVEYGIWRTDGRADGTREIFSFENGDSLPDRFASLPGGLVLFTRNWSVGGPRGELWRTDGTAEGTWRLLDHTGFEGRVGLSGLTAVGEGALFFLRREEGLDLWRTDGTAQGTERVARPRTANRPLLGAGWVVPFADGLFFEGYDPWHGGEPWVSDGTAAGTRLVRELRPGAGGSLLDVLAVRGRQVVFETGKVGADGIFRTRLWVSDGTTAGTFPLTPAEGPGHPGLWAEAAFSGDRVVYAGTSPHEGLEPWVVSPSELGPAVEPPLPALPSPPEALRASAGQNGSVWLFWQPTGDAVNAYLLEARTPAAGEFRVLGEVSAVVGLPLLILEELPLGVPHTFRLRAVNPAGVSAPSNEASAIPRSGPVEACVPGPHHLCLLDDRFRVQVHWRDPRSSDHGTATARPLPGTERAGTFWFFDAANVELIVKVLDGRFVNRRWWVFSGGVTDVEYWLEAVDTATGETNVYHHGDRDLCGFADTSAFAGQSADAFPLPAAGRVAAADGAPLELVGGRFRVEVEWRDPRSGDSGSGQALPWSANTGFFWFFHPESVELVVKVLDGRPVNGRWWVFFGGLTDVAYTLRVIDTVGGGTATYEHPAGDLCGGADVGAFGETGSFPPEGS